MLVNVVFDAMYEEVDIIDVPEQVCKKAEEFQDQFFEWLYDKANDHKYWVVRNGKKEYCYYRSEAFVDWLNSHPLAKEEDKASLVKEREAGIRDGLPIIYF